MGRKKKTKNENSFMTVADIIEDRKQIFTIIEHTQNAQRSLTMSAFKRSQIRE